MSTKPAVRARKLEIGKRLRVFRLEELQDADEALIGRTFIPVITGVEKEEEEEHHLQAVISAAQVDGPKTEVFIPVPDASNEIPDYDSLYLSTFTTPHRLIRYHGGIDELANDTYDLDESDAEWLKQFTGKNAISEEVFEQIFTQLEQAYAETPENYPTLADLTAAAPQLGAHPQASTVCDYWKEKRAAAKHPLIWSTKPETKANDPDPFVCFRRRELRQTRKMRRNDQISYEKLKSLRDSLAQARTLMDNTLKRDRLKREALLLDMLAFDQKVKLHDLYKKYQPSLLLEDDELKTKKRPMQPPPPKLRISINGSGVKQVSSDRDSAITIPSLDPRLEAEQVQPELRLPPERVVMGVDPAYPTYVLHDVSSVSHPRWSESQFFDMTSALSVSFKAPVDERRACFEFVPSSRDSNGFSVRRRIGRGGRRIIDRRPPIDSSELVAGSKYDVPFLEAQDQDAAAHLAVDPALAWRPPFSVPIPFYTPPDLSSLNGGDGARSRLQRGGLVGRAGATLVKVTPGLNTSGTPPPPGGSPATPNPAKRLKLLKIPSGEVGGEDEKPVKVRHG